MALTGTGPVRYTAGDGGYGLRVLAEALQGVPKDVRPRIRTALKHGGEGLRAAAAANAAWSRRIPGALQVRTRFGAEDAGVYVLASQRLAPHARTIEGITGNAKFRHPLFGDIDRWYDQPTRPFLALAAQQRGDAAIAGINDALDAALRAAGLK